MYHAIILAGEPIGPAKTIAAIGDGQTLLQIAYDRLKEVVPDLNRVFCADEKHRTNINHKHVDVPELMCFLCFNDDKTKVIPSRDISEVVKVFPKPAAEFELSQIELSGQQKYHASCENDSQLLKLGEILFALQIMRCELEATKKTTALFKAFIPPQNQTTI